MRKRHKLNAVQTANEGGCELRKPQKKKNKSCRYRLEEKGEEKEKQLLPFLRMSRCETTGLMRYLVSNSSNGSLSRLLFFISAASASQSPA